MAIRQGSHKAAPVWNARNGLTEAGSLLMFALSVFLTVALLTYNPGDPSWFTNMEGEARNACGRAGAYLSSLILQWFGMGGFLIPAAAFFISASIHRREGSVRVLGTLGGMTVAVMSLTVFLSLQWKYWPYGGNLMLTGGAYGAWVSALLVHEFNPIGSSIVALLVFFVSLALSTPLSVARIGGELIRWISVFAWRSMRLLGTYLLYFIGLIAVRVAHASVEWMQKALDSAIQALRDRVERARADRLARIAAGVPPKAPQLSLAVPTIGQDQPEEAEEGSGPELPALLDASTPAPLNSPNALPELEKAGAAGLPVSPSAPSGPAILPHESNPAQQHQPAAGAVAGEKPTVAARALAKLARAKSTKRGAWKLPALEFLRKPVKVESSYDRERLIENSTILVQKFADFGIEGEVTAVRPGPVITLYEFKPGPGVKVSRIAQLADDLSMALSAQSVRILAPLPGKPVGIEIPSDERQTVYLREFLQHPDFHGPKHSIPVVMGKDIAGQTYLSDLARMPHLLAAGQTGSGKSVFMNGLICSLLYRFTPDELRMILVDPKFIEFRSYQDIPHLLLPVVDDPKNASTALKWAVREMERRYRILARLGARNLAGFNQKVDEMGADVVRDLLFAEENQGENASPSTAPGSDWIEAFEPDEEGAPRVGRLPYIVVIIDELADLMMVAKKEVEVSIARIAQKARAAGIHLVIATQRPSTDVITGLIKANLPSRVSFQLASFVDSKTILDRAGAERLLGQGDMLFIPPGISQLLRLHGAFVDDEEISKVTAFLKEQGKPVYRDEILLDADEEDESEEGEDSTDELWDEAVELVKRSGHASASFLQRHLKVGYNRAARMIETMEERGIVGPADGARPREVLMR